MYSLPAFWQLEFMIICAMLILSLFYLLLSSVILTFEYRHSRNWGKITIEKTRSCNKYILPVLHFLVKKTLRKLTFLRNYSVTFLHCCISKAFFSLMLVYVIWFKFWNIFQNKNIHICSTNLLYICITFFFKKGKKQQN